MSYLLGWHTGTGKEIYVYREYDEKIKQMVWGVTEDKERQFHFNSVMDAMDFYFGFHAYKIDAEKEIKEGYVLVVEVELNQFIDLRMYLEEYLNGAACRNN
jgi:hypothetical protein